MIPGQPRAHLTESALDIDHAGLGHPFINGITDTTDDTDQDTRQGGDDRCHDQHFDEGERCAYHLFAFRHRDGLVVCTTISIVAAKAGATWIETGQARIDGPVRPRVDGKSAIFSPPRL